jgi:hypothetical protein
MNRAAVFRWKGVINLNATEMTFGFRKCFVHLFVIPWQNISLLAHCCCISFRIMISFLGYSAFGVCKIHHLLRFYFFPPFVCFHEILSEIRDWTAMNVFTHQTYIWNCIPVIWYPSAPRKITNNKEFTGDEVKPTVGFGIETVESNAHTHTHTHTQTIFLKYLSILSSHLPR